MAVLPIILWPDQGLTKRCGPVENLQAIEPFVRDLFDTMYAAGGRGLAAPQVGRPVRVFVMDCGWKEEERTPLAMVNPIIMAFEKDQLSAGEGCLSIPGVTVQVARHKAVTVQWTAPEGDIHMADFDGFEARCIQHEMDHLNGEITFDRISADERAGVEAAYFAAQEKTR